MEWTSLKPSDVRKQSLRKAASRYMENVALADSYLRDRGISEATANALALGVVVDPEPGHELMVGRLAIPYITRSGIVDMKFRCLQHEDCKNEGCVKYLCLTGSQPHLYNVNAFFVDSPVIGLTEGEFDAGVSHYEVGIPSVGCPGAQAWQPHFARCFVGYETIILFADGDTAGREFAKRVVEDLPPLTVVNLPEKQDVTTVFLSEGAEGLRCRAGLE